MSKSMQKLAVAMVALLATVVARAETPAPAPAAAAETGKPAPAVKKQTTCPVMGGAIDQTLFVDYQGKRIYVCCGGCVSEVRQDPAKYVAKLAAAGVTLEPTPAPVPVPVPVPPAPPAKAAPPASPGTAPAPATPQP